MDIIRDNFAADTEMVDTANRIIDIGRQLAKYLNKEQAPYLLSRMVEEQKKMGHHHQSQTIIVNGNHTRWNLEELEVLHFVFLFLTQYHLALRYDRHLLPQSASNARIIRRVYNTAVITEQLDTTYTNRFRERDVKAFKDKVDWIMDHRRENSHISIIEKLRRQIKILGYTRKQNPSTGLYFFYSFPLMFALYSQASDYLFAS